MRFLKNTSKSLKELFSKSIIKGFFKILIWKKHYKII